MVASNPISGYGATNKYPNGTESGKETNADNHCKQCPRTRSATNSTRQSFSRMSFSTFGKTLPFLATLAALDNSLDLSATDLSVEDSSWSVGCKEEAIKWVQLKIKKQRDYVTCLDKLIGHTKLFVNSRIEANKSASALIFMNLMLKYQKQRQLSMYIIDELEHLVIQIEGSTSSLDYVDMANTILQQTAIPCQVSRPPPDVPGCAISANNDDELNLPCDQDRGIHVLRIEI